MTARDVAEYARHAAALCMVGLGASVPISTAVDSILLAVLVLAGLAGVTSATPVIRRHLTSTPPVWAAMLLFLLLVVGCLHGVASGNEAASMLGKYSELALIPLMVWGADKPEVRKGALLLFGVAVLANLVVSYTAAAGLPSLRRPQFPIGFKASITLSLLVSLGAFLFLLKARETRDRRWRFGLIALALVCIHNALFITIGRIGYIVLGLLMVYYVVTLFRSWRPRVLVLGALVLVAAAILPFSTPMQERVEEARESIDQYHPGVTDMNSVSVRFEFYRNTLALIEAHPLLGVGTGGFEPSYTAVARAQGVYTANPHNDYLLVGAMIGVPGTLALVLLYALIWRCAPGLESPLHRDLARGLVITMAVGGLFNSLLLDHTEGLLFAWMTALLFAGYDPARARPA